MKYSIIVPVYNVFSFLDKCLKSIEKQTYTKFEVIIVNDGTQDNSMDIINKYIKKDKRFQVYTKENGGLSDARNYGVTKANGDIIIFVDGDDYLDKDLLLNLEEEFSKSKEIEVIRYQFRLVDENGNFLEQTSYRCFSNLPATTAYPILLKDAYVDVAWAYAYRKEFFMQNKFMYAKGKINEDFGLTHLILVKAKHISSIPYVGYNYVQREGSIMTTKSRSQNLRKVYDTLYHYDNYIKILNEDSSIANSNRDLLIEYIIKTIIDRSRLLDKEDFDKYIKDLKKRKIYKYFPNETKKDKLRRMVIKFSLKNYILKNIR